MFPEAAESGRPLRLYLTTLAVTAEVSVRMPRHRDRFQADVTVRRGEAQLVEVPAGTTPTGMAVQERGVHITASAAVTVLAYRRESNACGAFQVNTVLE